MEKGYSCYLSIIYNVVHIVVKYFYNVKDKMKILKNLLYTKSNHWTIQVWEEEGEGEGDRRKRRRYH